MTNNYIRLLLLSCLLLTASLVSAQFRFSNKPSVGQSITLDTMTGVVTFGINFNADKPSSSWSKDTAGVISVSFQKLQNDRGFRSEVFDTIPGSTTTILNDDFRVRRWNSNENPVHVHSVDSLMAVLQKYQESKAGTADSVKNATWKPSASLFDVNGDPANQAFGTHPGMYKRVEYGFHFSFSGFAVTSDIEFELDTYDAGNTGQTASYALIVAIGNETDTVATIENFYVSGSGPKTVKLAEAAGIDISRFTNQKVYMWLKTQGTGTAVSPTSFDPTIVFDNFKVAYQLPFWVTPAAGAIGNAIVGNQDNPLVIPVNQATATSLLLQTKGRVGSLTITNDLQNNMVKLLDFPDTLGLMANDGNGNYNVPVPYTIAQAVYDPGTLTYTKAKITVAAPADGPVNDDMMFSFTAAARDTATEFARIELNAGTRIWYDYYLKGFNPKGKILYVSARGPETTVRSDSITVAKLEEDGYLIQIVDDNNVAPGGYDYSGYDVVVFGESSSSSNVNSFANIDKFPAPCLMMEPLAVRTDKWTGWLPNPDPATYNNNDYPGFKEDRTCAEGTTQLQITEVEHYITEGYTLDTVVNWSNAVCGTPSVIFAHGFNINRDIRRGIPLAKNNSSAISEPNLWAVPAGTPIPGDTALMQHRLVLFGIHELGLYGNDNVEYATSDFFHIVRRSIEWLMGSGADGQITSTEKIAVSHEITAYPNPATGEVKLRFDLESAGRANLSLVNMMGQRTQVFRNQQFFSGRNDVTVNLDGFAPGIYVYQLEAEGKAFVGKLIISE